MKNKDLMKISELSKKSGIPISTIRYYILEKLLPTAMKTGKTRSFYSDIHLKTLELIKHKQVVEMKPLSVIRKEIKKEIPFPKDSLNQPDLSSDKYETILSSATELFLKKGYADTSVADIAQHAKMSKETIYLNFKNKEEIFMACADRIFRHMYDDVWNEIKGNKDMAARLTKRGKAFFSSYPQWIAMMNLVKSLSVGDNPTFKAKFHQLIQQMVNPMVRDIENMKREGHVRKDFDSELAGYILMGISEYGAALITNEKYSEEEIVASIKIIFNETGLLKA